MVVHARRWHLVGHDHLRGAIRMYRLDGIGGPAELPGRFTPPDGFDPMAHVLRTLTLGGWTHRVEVWLDTDLESLPWPFMVTNPPALVTALAEHVAALGQAVARSRPAP
ncbi:helix-turn-helix transcriptional regulator [Nonomuraea sp. CA-141351]|uniref:helix-turn-helix transcriptional regulator n=1 Tax=Nonomuraea sp. CA-141351 TaxID=3239996 RepID=UPI003D94F326